MNMKDNKLTLSLVQSDILWEDTDRNLDHLDGLLKNIKSDSDVILLPEMFTTGFSMNAHNLAESPDGKSFQWMQNKANEHNSVVAGSIMINQNGAYYNRFYWLNPDGESFSYDKHHLFTIGGENQVYEPGNTRLIISFKGWRICPLICYDLRFPVWSRNNNAYDLLIYVANWPAARNHVWNTLLRARAIENQCYVAGVNRVGRDGHNIHYIGESCIVHPKGYLSTAIHDPYEHVLQCTINLNELLEFRKKFPVLDDGDLPEDYILPMYKRI